jgi:hypothetical protein
MVNKEIKFDDMKKIICFTLLILIVLFQSCKRNSSEKNNELELKSIPQRNITNKDFLKIVSSYKNGFKCRGIVFCLFIIKQGYDSTEYLLDHIDYTDLLFSFYPDSYFIYENEYFFIYNGTDKLVDNSTNLYETTKILELKKLKKSFKLGTGCDIPGIKIVIDNKSRKAKKCRPEDCLDSPLVPPCEDN